MPTSSNVKILAIDPGTRELGFALLEGLELVYHGVRTVDVEDTRRARLERGRQVVARLAHDLEPDLLTLEKTFFANAYGTGLLRLLADGIRRDARRRRLPVVWYAPSTVKKTVTGNGWATKREVAEVVVAIYPQLRFYMIDSTKRAWRHHANRFDAVALGLTALEVWGANHTGTERTGMLHCG